MLRVCLGEWDPQVDGRRYLVVRAAEKEEEKKRLVEEFWSAIKGGTLEY